MPQLIQLRFGIFVPAPHAPVVAAEIQHRLISEIPFPIAAWVSFIGAEALIDITLPDHCASWVMQLGLHIQLICKQQVAHALRDPATLPPDEEPAFIPTPGLPDDEDFQQPFTKACELVLSLLANKARSPEQPFNPDTIHQLYHYYDELRVWALAAPGRPEFNSAEELVNQCVSTLTSTSEIIPGDRDNTASLIGSLQAEIDEVETAEAAFFEIEAAIGNDAADPCSVSQLRL